MEELAAARTRVRIWYNDRDISADVSPMLESFEYTDFSNGQVDSLEVTFTDPDGRWRGSWYPDEGARLRADIVWSEGSVSRRLACGQFVVDNPRYASPGRITLAGTALGISTNLRRQTKTREWKNVTLKGLAERIAAEQGVTISYHGPETAPISKVTQKDESDIQLLLRQSSRTGYALKIDRNRLVIYNRKEMDAAPAAFTIERVGGGVTEYEFSEEKLETYRRAIVRYKHPDKGLLRAVYEPANAAESGYDLIVREHCGSQAEAMELGRARLEAANRGRLTCSMGHRGDVRMVSGVAVKLHGFGRYDGRYMIDEARHSVQGGYSTGLTMVRVT